MEAIVAALTAFLRLIGDNNGEAQLTEIQRRILDAQRGKRESIRFFELEELPKIEMGNVKKAPYFSLMQNQYNSYQTLSIVGAHMDNYVLKNINLGLCSISPRLPGKCNRKKMSLLQWTEQMYALHFLKNSMN